MRLLVRVSSTLVAIDRAATVVVRCQPSECGHTKPSRLVVAQTSVVVGATATVTFAGPVAWRLPSLSPAERARDAKAAVALST